MNTCIVEYCTEDAYAKNYCRPHYNRQRLYGDPNYVRPAKTVEPCSVTGCDTDGATRGLCGKHYTRWKRTKNAADLEPRPCEICGNSFDPPGTRSFVCGDAECVRLRKLSNNRASQAKKKPTLRDVQCAGCGKPFTTHSARKYCATNCPGRARASLTPLREAVANTDYPAIMSLLRDRSQQDANGCWEWTGARHQQNYPQVGFSKPPAEGMPKTYTAHRLMLEAKAGHSIKGMHAHHTCANRGCINPDHLELATAAENVGEMMARLSYEARIKELELALSEYNPKHPLLR